MQPCSTAVLLQLLAATSTSHALDADAAAAAWSAQRGVHAPKLAIRTTTDSVGGRGLFATDAVSKGEVVASIPKDLVWRAPAPADLPPEGRAWQTQLATQLLLAAAAGEEAWAPWLDSLPTDFDAFAYLDCEDVDGWVQETAQRWGLPADRLAETLGERRGAYARRAAWFFSEEGPAALCGASPQSFRLAYCRVLSLSRAVTVDGKGCIGLVPFYDFLNHGRLRQRGERRTSNVRPGRAPRGRRVGRRGLVPRPRRHVAGCDGRHRNGRRAADGLRRRRRRRGRLPRQAAAPVRDLPASGLTVIRHCRQRRRRAPQTKGAQRESRYASPYYPRKGRKSASVMFRYCAAPRR